MRAREIYTKSRKPSDIFWNAYVCRPVAALLLSFVVNSRITPNQITLASLFVAGCAVALWLAVPGYLGLVLGVLVFELSYVLDCADGMLARVRGIASPAGHLLDFLMDELKAFAILAAISVRLATDHDDLRFLQIGLFGLVMLASGTALTTFLRRPEIAGPAPAQPTKPRALGPIAIVERLAKFFIHYPSYIWAAALAGRLELYLYPYVIVNALYAARTLAGVASRFGRAR
jgi:phosphatidylglycerophosphate synthase